MPSAVFPAGERSGGGGQLNEKLFQPEGEQVSDAQDGQEGKCEIPPLKRRKKKRADGGRR